MGNRPYASCPFFNSARNPRAAFTRQKSKDDSYQEFAAHWGGNRLISEEKGPGGAKITRSFELSNSGEQLYQTVRLNGGQSNSTIVIRYVYDISGGNAQ